MRLTLFKLTSFFLLLFLGYSGTVKAQRDCESLACNVETLSLNTGVDHAINMLYPVPPHQDSTAILRDPYWQTVQSPDPDINLGNPWVIPHVAVHWHNGPPLVSRWLSPLPNTSYTINNPSPEPTFIFERCFCTCESGPVNLDFLVFGDDAIVRVELGGTVLFNAPNNTGPNFGDVEEAIHIEEAVALEAGENCLRIHLRNTGGDRMGFKVEGTVTGPHLLDNPCCNPRGSIAGFKFHDQNSNGVWDNGEPPLSNWPINLSNSTSVLTDTIGFYSFNNLPPGNYTVWETQQAGWWQTMPPNNQSYNVTLNGFQSLTLNFGNSDEAPPISGDITGKKFHDLDCDGVRDDNEPFLAGWTFELYDDNGNLIQSALSDRDGCFAFTSLPGGSYTVQEVPQTGWQQSTPTGGAGFPVLIEESVSYLVEFGNCLVDNPDACCEDPGPADIFYEDFEGTVVNNTTDYSLGTGQLPGEYAYLNAAQATSLSGGGWDVQGYSSGGNCDPNDRFMVVNGRTNGTGEEQIYRSNILNTQDDETYSICVQFKHLPQCVFDVVPTVRVEVIGVVGLNSTTLFASPNTQVITGPGNCDYMTISGTFTGLSPSGLQGAFIRIFLDETGIGEGNDLVVDEIIVQEVPIVPAALRGFSHTKSLPDANGNYTVSVQAVSPLPADCIGRWEVYQIADANDQMTPIPGTYMTGNDATGWPAATNFPGYNSIPPAAAVFNNSTNYVIRRIVDCDCYEEGASRLLLNSTQNGFRAIFLGPEEGSLNMDIPSEEPPSGELPPIDKADNIQVIEGIKVIPNPFQERCTIVFAAPPKQSGKLQVMDLSGKVIRSIDYQVDSRKLEVDLTNLPAATYVISGLIGDQVISKKIIKQ